MKTYTQRHSGTAIVCGAAPCVFDDLAKAKQMRPDADLLGCNLVPAMIPEIKKTWTQEAVKNGRMIRAQVAEDVEIHTAMLPKPGMEYLYQADYVWPELSWICGTSGFAAGLWARHGLGYDEVILAGVPLDKSVNVYRSEYKSPFNNPEMPFAGEELFEHWHQQIRTHCNNGKTENIFSMSGATMYLLGAPKE